MRHWLQERDETYHMIRLKNAWANEAVYSGQWANESANWSKFKNVAGLCPSVSLCLYVCVWLPVFICAFGSLCLCVRLAFCVYVCVWLSVLMCASGSLCLCVRWALCLYVYVWLRVFICAFGSRCLRLRARRLSGMIASHNKNGYVYT